MCHDLPLEEISKNDLEQFQYCFKYISRIFMKVKWLLLKT